MKIWDLLFKKKTHYHFRYAKKQDIAFIVSEVSEGMSKGFFAFEYTDGLDEFYNQMYRIAEAHESGEKIGNVLFIFEGVKDRKPLAFALLAAGQADQKMAQHLIMVMFGVASTSRGKGIGSLFLKDLMAHAGMPMVASCLPASERMARILLNHQFKLISVTPRGKRTFMHS